MELMNDKVDGSGGAQGTLPATQWNQLPSEVQQLITDTSQSLTNADLTQLSKAVASYVSNGDFYIDSGSANTYVLGVADNNKPLITYFKGAKFYFVPANTNTGACTINVVGLGVKDFKDSIGEDLIAGELIAGELAMGSYDAASDQVRQVPLLTRTNMVDMKSGRKNLIPDSGFHFWPEGTSFTAVGYTAAMWFCSDANIAVDRVASPFAGSVYALQAAASGGVQPQMETFIELEGTGGIGPFIANEDYTLSFDLNDVAAGADVNVFIQLVDDSAGTGSVTVLSNIKVADTINGSQRVEHTFNFGNPSPGGSNVALRITFVLSTNNSVFIIDNVQLEKGKFATNFEGRLIGEEQSNVNRYIEVITGTPNQLVISTGQALTASTAIGVIPFHTQKRVVPTITFSGPDFDCGLAGGGAAGCTISGNLATVSHASWVGNSGAGLVAGEASILRIYGTSANSIIFDARF